jgi:Xaa-Pro aminopeptidase
MQSFFESDFFTRNRDNLRAALGSDVPIVLTGNGVMQRSGDEPSPFYQDSNFWYLTGLNGADLTLVMTSRDTYIIVPARSVVREAFDGAHEVDAYATRSGITAFLGEAEGWKRLRDEVHAAGSVATLGTPPPHMKHYGVYTLPYRRRLLNRLRRLHPGLNIHDIREEMAAMRCIKQPEELSALQSAIDVTTATLKDLATEQVLGKALHEYELEAALSYGFRIRGAEGHGFSPIVGAGKHSTTLHHMENNGDIGPDDVIVLDVGAGVEHYAADISRTVSKQPLAGRKAAVFKAVAAAQDYALSLLKPGVQLREYETAVETFVGEQLMVLGVIDSPTKENIRRYFPHATSHFLGLDTHDVGDYRKPLQPGMVVTCEPGIYLPDEGIGVRLEDDVLITETGYTVLSSACPRELTPVK